MTTTRHFHLGDILSITTERLVSPTGIDGVYKILNWMTGDNLFTHQLPRAARECQEPLLAQHPDLADIAVPEDLRGREAVDAWLAQITPVYGQTRPVTPLDPADHTQIDPITELRMIRPDLPVITVEVPPADSGEAGR